MDMTTTSAARPFDPATARPSVIERAEGPQLALSPGGLWTHRLTGETFTLTSRRRAGVNIEGPYGNVMVTIAELLAGYAWVGCNHRDFCCGTHGGHTIPHRGCVLR